MPIALFHGDNRLEIEEAWHEATSDCRGAGAFNCERFDAPLDLAAFRQACAALPFLMGGERRTIVVRDALRRGGTALGQRLLPVIAELPPSTFLLFVEFAPLPAAHPLLRWMRERQEEGIVIRRFDRPKPRALPAWIAKRAGRYGVTIDNAAAALLARQIGNDTLTLDQELRKLATYRSGTGRIVRDDVAALVPYTLGGDLIFKVVDAVGARNVRQALILLHRMLDAPSAPHPGQVMAMIIRQFRMLAQARWLLDHGQGTAIGEQLGLHYDFLVDKVRRQSGLFSADQLHRAYTLLLEHDRAVKSGTLSLETALDLLVVQLTRL